MTNEFRALSELDLLEFFGVEPIEREVNDGYWCYETSDSRGVTLRFSFHLFERSVQTALSLAGSPVVTVSHEGAERMLVRDGKLRCEFSAAGEKTTLTVGLERALSVVWSSLRTE